MSRSWAIWWYVSRGKLTPLALNQCAIYLQRQGHLHTPYLPVSTCINAETKEWVKGRRMEREGREEEPTKECKQIPNDQYCQQVEKLCSVIQLCVICSDNRQQRKKDRGEIIFGIGINSYYFLVVVLFGYKYVLLKLQLKTDIHKIPRNFQNTCPTIEKICQPAPTYTSIPQQFVSL